MFNVYLFKDQILTFEKPLDPKKYNIGSTIDDYAKCCYIKLTESQYDYSLKHPKASAAEIISEGKTETTMQTQNHLDVGEYIYNKVRGVIINGIPTIISDLYNLLIVVNSYLNLGKSNISLKLGDYIYNLDIFSAKNLIELSLIYLYEADLRALQIYYNLNNGIADDYTKNWPEIPEFKITL